MSTTKQVNEDPPKWEEMGKGKPPKELKEYIEKMIEFNNTAIEILKDTKDWLVTNGNNSR